MQWWAALRSCASLAGLVLCFIASFILLCDRSFSAAYKAGLLRTPRLPGTKPRYRPLPHKCETHITSVYPENLPFVTARPWLIKISSLQSPNLGIRDDIR